MIVRRCDRRLRPPRLRTTSTRRRRRLRKRTNSALCTTPSQAALDAARKSPSARTVDAWSRIEIIRFGPVTEENRLERMLFWPDRKGTGLKQVQAALAAKDPTAADASAARRKERRHAGARRAGIRAVRHRLGSAGDAATPIAAPMARRSLAISTPSRPSSTRPGQRRTAFAKTWANPSADNPLYRDGTEAVTELMDVFVTGIGTGARRQARRLSRQGRRRTTSRSRRCSGAPARPSMRWPAISPA